MPKHSETSEESAQRIAEDHRAAIQKGARLMASRAIGDAVVELADSGGALSWEALRGALERKRLTAHELAAPAFEAALEKLPFA